MFDELRRASAGGTADYYGATWERVVAEKGLFWPIPEVGHPGTPRLFEGGRFYHPDGRARFHAVPYRGEPEALENHYLPLRGKAGPSVLTLFAHEPQSRVLCYANANLTRADQPGELLQFVEFWHAVTGKDPPWLYFDSKLVPYAELARLQARGIWFVIGRRDMSYQSLADLGHEHPSEARPIASAVDVLQAMKTMRAAPAGEAAEA